MSYNQHKLPLKQQSLQQTEKLCLCGQPIAHARVGLCYLCYKQKRKHDWKNHELQRRTKDPDRHNNKKLYFKNMYHKKYRESRLVYIKLCNCGNIALKSSKYMLCKQCSIKNASKNKIRYQCARKKTHLQTKIRENIKSRMRIAISGKLFKSKSIVIYLGCSLPQYMEFLESLFYNKTDITMSWDNYGEWHIDHIVPISTFSADDLHKAFHYTNTQPMWKEEHVRKTAEENRSKMLT